jgi:hypothetical protein
MLKESPEANCKTPRKRGLLFLSLLLYFTLLYFTFCLETKRNKKFKRKLSTAAQAGHIPAAFSGHRAAQNF